MFVNGDVTLMAGRFVRSWEFYNIKATPKIYQCITGLVGD